MRKVACSCEKSSPRSVAIESNAAEARSPGRPNAVTSGLNAIDRDDANANPDSFH